MAPGAPVILVDPGRVMHVFSWKIAMAWHLIRTYGLQKTLEIFREAKAVAEQNAYIRTMQRNGSFWTHSHEEFCAAVIEAGFHIESHTICFRGNCDLVMARK